MVIIASFLGCVRIAIFSCVYVNSVGRFLPIASVNLVHFLVEGEGRRRPRNDEDDEGHGQLPEAGREARSRGERGTKFTCTTIHSIEN